MKYRIGYFLMVIVFLISSAIGFAQTNNYSILGYNYKFVQKRIGSEDGINVILYRNNQKLLTHTIFKEDGDCSANNIEIGKYDVVEDKIIFYSYWAGTDRQPMPIFPYGFRKQVYKVQKDGRLILEISEIYIEDYVENKTDNRKYFESEGSWYHKGIEFLNKIPQTSYEIDALKDYTQRIESHYKSTLVFGNEAQLLEQEVRGKLKNEIKIATDDWEEGEVYGNVKK